MSRLRACIVAMFLATPMVASADPVKIVSTSSGTIDPNTFLLSLLDLYPHSGDPPALPFSAFLDSTLDPDSPDVRWNSYGYSGRSTQVSLGFRVGEREVAFAGSALVSVQQYGDGHYEHEVVFPYLHYYVSLAHTMAGVPHVPGNATLAHRSLTSRDGLSATLGYWVTPHNPDAPGFLPAQVSAQFASLNVVSAVPEPASAAMLTVGLLAMGSLLRQRRARQRNVASPGTGV